MLRDKIKQLEESLARYQKFEGSDYNIKKILELASQYFKGQTGSTLETGEGHSDLQLFSPLQQSSFASES
jgi:hypothetical protein